VHNMIEPAGDPQERIPLLAAGRGWLALDKPSGISIHNQPGFDLCSRVTTGLRAVRALRERMAPEPDFGVHPVHRLDRETSGVIILAVRREAFRFLTAQFAARTVCKGYVAILHGHLAQPTNGLPWGCWDWPLASKSSGRQRPAGQGPKMPSHTRFRALGHSAHYTLVECEPLTGRVHQIRRHAKLAGHPVVGDLRYGSRRAVHFLKTQAGFSRLGLHAMRLTLVTPDASQGEIIHTREISPALLKLFRNDACDTSPAPESAALKALFAGLALVTNKKNYPSSLEIDGQIF